MRVSKISAQSQNGKKYKGQGVTLFAIKGVHLKKQVFLDKQELCYDFPAIGWFSCDPKIIL